jgi:formyltetrahydrofolate hydrolase
MTTNKDTIEKIIYPFFDETIEGERYISKLIDDLTDALQAKEKQVREKFERTLREFQLDTNTVFKDKKDNIKIIVTKEQKAQNELIEKLLKKLNHDNK